MNTYDFVKNLITHCETEPEKIDLVTATERFRLLDPEHVPSDMTPETFLSAWNAIVENDLPAGNWL